MGLEKIRSVRLAQIDLGRQRSQKANNAYFP